MKRFWHVLGIVTLVSLAGWLTPTSEADALGNNDDYTVTLTVYLPDGVYYDSVSGNITMENGLILDEEKLDGQLDDHLEWDELSGDLYLYLGQEPVHIRVTDKDGFPVAGVECSSLSYSCGQTDDDGQLEYYLWGISNRVELLSFSIDEITINVPIVLVPAGKSLVHVQFDQPLYDDPEIEPYTTVLAYDEENRAVDYADFQPTIDEAYFVISTESRLLAFNVSLISRDTYNYIDVTDALYLFTEPIHFADEIPEIKINLGSFEGLEVGQVEEIRKVIIFPHPSADHDIELSWSIYDSSNISTNEVKKIFVKDHLLSQGNLISTTYTWDENQKLISFVYVEQLNEGSSVIGGDLKNNFDEALFQNHLRVNMPDELDDVYLDIQVIFQVNDGHDGSISLPLDIISGWYGFAEEEDVYFYGEGIRLRPERMEYEWIKTKMHPIFEIYIVDKIWMFTKELSDREWGYDGWLIELDLTDLAWEIRWSPERIVLNDQVLFEVVDHSGGQLSQIQKVDTDEYGDIVDYYPEKVEWQICAEDASCPTFETDQFPYAWAAISAGEFEIKVGVETLIGNEISAQFTVLPITRDEDGRLTIRGIIPYLKEMGAELGEQEVIPLLEVIESYY